MGSEFEERVEITAPTVDEAIILGLTRLGITREEALIEILDEGSKGFLGLGSREALVRVVRRSEELVAADTWIASTPESVQEQAPAPEETVLFEEAAASDVPEAKSEAPVSVQEPEESPPPDVAKTTDREPKPVEEGEIALDRELVERVALDVGQHLFGDLQVTMKTMWREADRPTLWISLRGKDADALVGAHAQTLDAAQYLVRALVRRQVEGRFNLVVDADGYRGRRQKSLESLARKMADKAVQTGRPVRLRPMPASERRVIHISLRKDSRVRTESVGSGRNRAVTVIPVSKNSR